MYILKVKETNKSLDYFQSFFKFFVLYSKFSTFAKLDIVLNIGASPFGLIR